MKIISNISVEGNVLFQVGYVQDHPFRFNPSRVSTMYNVQMESVRYGPAEGSQSSNICMTYLTLGYHFLWLNVSLSTPKMQSNDLSHLREKCQHLRSGQKKILLFVCDYLVTDSISFIENHLWVLTRLWLIFMSLTHSKTSCKHYLLICCRSLMGLRALSEVVKHVCVSAIC